MENKEFGKQLEKRIKEFAIDIIRLLMTLPNITEAIVIKNQLTKSGTSELLAIFTTIGKNLKL